MGEKEFIEKIAPLCVKYAKKYGFKIASAAIAQACLESGYGTSNKAKFNNYFGLKYRPNRVTCNNGYFLDGGSEQNPDGTYTPLPSATAWYNFDTMETGVEGYYQFISIPNYAKVKEATIPLEYLQEIKNAHYATSLNYVNNVYNVVVKWNLQKYDNSTNNETQQSTTNNSIVQLSIINKTSDHNTTMKMNRDIKWIVLHYTAGTSSTKGAAQNIANYFSKTTNQASADFIVDDAEIVQYNPDPKQRYCWAVGGAKYPNKSNTLAAKYYGQCKNDNSISIEMCSRKTNTATLNASDDDWYITDATVNNAVKLTKYLMKLYNIDINHVIMHNMVTGKWCPQPWSKNENALSLWNGFLNKVAGSGSNAVSQQPSPAPSTTVPFIVTVLIPNLNIRKTPNGDLTGKFTGKGKFTIVKVDEDWGLLKSGAGWIYLKNKSYVSY